MARLARGAAVTAVAGAVMLPKYQTAGTPAPQPPQDAVVVDCVGRASAGILAGTAASVTLAISEAPSEWTRQREREFRKLALQEARGELLPAEVQRLEELTRWRNRLLHGQTTEEVLRQLKRERLIARMESVLKEYVQFHETEDQARSGA